MTTDSGAPPISKDRLSALSEHGPQPSKGRSNEVGTDRFRPRILVAEDDYIVGLEIEYALAEAGFEVTDVTGSAEKAIALARETRPSLVVMDIRLQGDGDGIGAAIEIFRQTGVRCIFATSHQDPAAKRRAEAAFPLGWLPKPYETAALVDLIRGVLATQ